MKDQTSQDKEYRYSLYDKEKDTWRGARGKPGATANGKRLYMLNQLTCSLTNDDVKRSWFSKPNPNDEVVVYELVEVYRVPATEFFKRRLNDRYSKAERLQGEGFRRSY